MYGPYVSTKFSATGRTTRPVETWPEGLTYEKNVTQVTREHVDESVGVLDRGRARPGVQLAPLVHDAGQLAVEELVEPARVLKPLTRRSVRVEGLDPLPQVPLASYTFLRPNGEL